MATQARDTGFTHGNDLLGPLKELLDRGLRQPAEALIASYALWICSEVESGALGAAEADEFFTRLDHWLEERQTPALSGPVQDIIFEGNLFHHFGDPQHPEWGPDLLLIRNLALQVLG